MRILVTASLWIAAIVYSVILLMIFTYMTGTPGGPCHVVNGASVREVSIPSYLYVLGAIGSYGLGHLSNRVTQGTADIQDLGEGRWKGWWVVVVKAATTLFLLTVCVISAVEMIALNHGLWPITYFVRCATDAQPMLSLVAALIFSFLVGRWLWVQT